MLHAISVFNVSVHLDQLCYYICCHACLKTSDKFGGFADCMYVLYVCLVAFVCIASSLRLIWLRSSTRNGWAAMSLLMVVDIGGTVQTGNAPVALPHSWSNIMIYEPHTRYQRCGNPTLPVVGLRKCQANCASHPASA
jgi:hypothetical protein